MKIKDVPSAIYHYCGYDTFCDIVKNRSFWLTDYRKTNDLLERNVITADILSNAIEGIKNESYRNKDDIFFETVKVYFPLNNDRNVYLGSFCEENDLLELWTRYGDDGRGIAIGFDPSYFDLSLTSPFFSSDVTKSISLSPVDYDIVRITKNIKDSIYNFLQQYRKENDKTRSFQMMFCAANLVRYSNIAKHHAFQGEKEWRIIYTPAASQTQNQNMFSDTKIREENVKYTEMYFNEDKKSQPITNITIGPRAEANEGNIKAILSEHCYKNVIICKSGIPYRGNANS